MNVNEYYTLTFPWSVIEIHYVGFTFAWSVPHHLRAQH